MPSFSWMLSSAYLAGNVVAKHLETDLFINGAESEGYFGVGGLINIDMASSEPINTVSVEHMHTEAGTPPILPCDASTQSSPLLALETLSVGLPHDSLTGPDWADIVEDEIEQSMAKDKDASCIAICSSIAISSDDTSCFKVDLEPSIEAQDDASLTTGIQSIEVLIPTYYTSATGQDWADMDNEEHLISCNGSLPELDSSIPTDSEPTSPATLVSICLTESDEKSQDYDDFESLSVCLQALDLSGLPRKHEQYEATGQDWQTCSRYLANMTGLNLQVGDRNYKSGRMHLEDYLYGRSSWNLSNVPGQKHYKNTQKGNNSKKNASEYSETEYNADNFNNNDTQDQLYDVSNSLPNLRQYIPQNTTEQLNEVLAQMDETTRKLPVATQYAQGVIDWTHMCQASRDILAVSKRPRRFLQQADRSVDWFWDVVKADGSKAFHYRGLSTPESVPVLSSEITATKPVHHYNYCGSPLYAKSATPPAVSLWFAFSPGVADHNVKSKISLHKQVLMSEAGNYLDPFAYSGPEVSHFMQGTALQEFATGLVEKVYVPVGTWMDDDYGPDEDVPQLSTRVSRWFNGSFDTINRPIFPYVVTAGDDGDTVINDGQHVHSISISKARKPVEAVSSLRYVQMADGTADDRINTMSTSQTHNILNDCETIIAQIMSTGDPDANASSKIVLSFGEFTPKTCLRTNIKSTATELSAVLSKLDMLIEKDTKSELDKECDMLTERLHTLVDPSRLLPDHGQPNKGIARGPAEEPAANNGLNEAIVDKYSDRQCETSTGDIFWRRPGLDGVEGELETEIFKQTSQPALHDKVLVCVASIAGTKDDLSAAKLSEKLECTANNTSAKDSAQGIEFESSVTLPHHKRPGYIYEGDSLEGSSFFSTQTKQQFESWLNKEDSEDLKVTTSGDEIDEEIVELMAYGSPFKRPKAALGFRRDNLRNDLCVNDNDSEHSGEGSDAYLSDNSGMMINEWPDSEDEAEPPSDICVKVLDTREIAGHITEIKTPEALIPDEDIPDKDIPELLLPDPKISLTPVSQMAAPNMTTAEMSMPRASLPTYVISETSVTEHLPKQEDDRGDHDTELILERASSTALPTIDKPPESPVFPTIIRSISASTATSIIIEDDEFEDDSDVENCLLSEHEVAVRERVWLRNNPGYVNTCDTNVLVEDDIPRGGKHCGVDFDLLKFEDTTPVLPCINLETIPQEPVTAEAAPLSIQSINSKFREELELAIATPLPPALEDEVALAQEELRGAAAHNVDDSEVSEQYVEQVAPTMVPSDDLQPQPPLFDCGGLLEFSLPRPKVGDILLYGSIAIYLGHRLYSALRR